MESEVQAELEMKLSALLEARERKEVEEVLERQRRVEAAAQKEDA